MDQTTAEPTAVPMATQQPGRPSGSRTKSKPAQRDKPKPVKATIVLEPWMDVMLTNLAFARMQDRSELVRQYLGSALRAVNMEREIEKAKKRFIAPPARLAKDDQAKPTDDVVRPNPDADSTSAEDSES
jgi:hypothetical protein